MQNNLPHNLQTGDILHCQGSKLLSRIIRRLTKSTFSHTALVISIEDTLFIVDAQKDGVQMRSFDTWTKDYKYKFAVHRSKVIASSDKLIKQRAFLKIGTTAYDFEGLIIKSPIELLTGQWRQKPVEDNRMYCSEFVMWVYGVKESYRMNPQDAYEWCIKEQFMEIDNTI